MTKQEANYILDKATIDRKAGKKFTREELVLQAQALDFLHTKTPKRVTKKEKSDRALEEALSKKDEPVIEKPKKVKESDEWDVKIGDPIEYFDSDLSYELTGYRPITKDRGLDFDPKLFTEAAEKYKKDGRYTDFIEDTYAWRNWWLEEARRCKEGYTVGKYRLTGENYFYLNYFRMKSPLNEKGGVSTTFPTFLNKQYEYFHYIELCRATGHDGLIFKSRGIGASEIAASLCAHCYTFVAESYTIVTAYLEDHIENTLQKVWQEFDFLNEKTQNAFSNPRQKVDTKLKKRASLINEDKNEVGWMSTVEGVTTDSADKLRGNRVQNLFFEEAGNHPKLEETYIRSRALTDYSGIRVGNAWVFGTAGSKGATVAGLRKMFYNPTDYQILPYYNKFTKEGDQQFTGYFVPSFSMWFGYVDQKTKQFVKGYDDRGVVDEEAAKKFYLDRWSKIKDPTALKGEKAEFCFTPEDAFSLEGENRFDKERLYDQYSAIVDRKQVEGPKKVRLYWNLKEGVADLDRRPNIEYSSIGKIDMVEEPILDATGQPITNLYFSAIDGIDSDSTTSTGQTDVSQFCMVVMRRQFGLKPPKVVAIYKERPQHINTAYDNALKLCSFYNCKTLLEATRVNIKSYFENKHKLNYLMRRPRVTANAGQTNFKQWGVPATTAIIDHQLDLIEQYIVDYCEEIQFPDMLDELQRYSYVNKRKFDIVAAFGICLIAGEELSNYPVRDGTAKKKILDVGYYTNEYGQKVFGVINRKYDNEYYKDL